MNSEKEFTRVQCDELVARLEKPRKHIQAVVGAHHIGKTALVLQALNRIDRPHLFESGDAPTLKDRRWLETQWKSARQLATGGRGAVLVLDEIQKIPYWSEIARLWDEDTRRKVPLQVLLLGSAPLLLEKGLSENLMGRFEILRLPHWGYPEMRDALGFSLEQYVFHGGYPGAGEVIGDEERWKDYVLTAIIEAAIGRDLLLLSRIGKPDLLRQLVKLGCVYSAQILSLRKIAGALQDTGNTTTIANYLELLSGAGILAGIQKFPAESVRARSSSPKLAVFDNALMSAMSYHSLASAQEDREFWGRLVESAVGAYLVNARACRECEVFYWRDPRGRELDFVVRHGTKLAAIDIESGRPFRPPRALTSFKKAHPDAKVLLVGGDGIPLEDFLSHPVSHWVA